MRRHTAYSKGGRTRKKVVELVDTRDDAEVDRLVAEVHNDTTKHGRVNL